MLEKQLERFSNSGGNFFNLQIGLIGHLNMALAAFGSSRSLAMDIKCRQAFLYDSFNNLDDPPGLLIWVYLFVKIIDEFSPRII